MPPLLGIAGYSGSGKTTLLLRLLPQLMAQGLTLAIIKHSHHRCLAAKHGSDSERYQALGVPQVLLVGADGWCLNGQQQPPAARNDILAYAAALMPCDLILVEGYKHEPIDKIEVINSALASPTLYASDPRVIAVAADSRLAIPLPLFLRDDIAGLSAFIMDYVHHDTEQSANR